MSELSKVPEKYSGKKIYSISKLQSFKQCKLQYWLNYHERIKGTGNIYSILGGLVHDQMELLQPMKINNAKALQGFKDKLLEMELSGDIKFMSPKIENNYKESLYHYFNHYKPLEAKKVALEKEFYVEIEGIILRGFIDAVLLNEDDTITIIDYKTSSSYSGEKKKEAALQLILYAYAMESLYGAEINTIAWNMLKYAKVTYFKLEPPKTKKQTESTIKEKVKTCQRNEIVKDFTKEITIELQKLGKSDIEIEIMLQSNTLPEEIKDKFKIEDSIVDYKYDEEEKQRLINFVVETVKEIESKSEEEDFPAIMIDKSSEFFCTQLCDFKSVCTKLEEYQGGIKEQDSLMEDLFG